MARREKPVRGLRKQRRPDLRGFKRSAEGYDKVSRVLAAGGCDKRAMDGARPSQDRMSCRGRSGPRPTGHGVPPEPARSPWSTTPRLGAKQQNDLKSVMYGKSVS